MTDYDHNPDRDRTEVRGGVRDGVRAAARDAPRDGARRALTAAFAIAGGAALLLLLGVTVAEVIARHLLGFSLLGAEDLATMCLTVFVAGAVVCAAREGGHVSVDLIGRFGGGRLRRTTDVLSRLLGTGATAVASLALFAKGGCGVECGEVTGSLAIVHTPFYYVLGVSMATLSLLLASGLIRGPAARGEGGLGGEEGLRAEGNPRAKGGPQGKGDPRGEGT